MSSYHVFFGVPTPTLGTSYVPLPGPHTESPGPRILPAPPLRGHHGTRLNHPITAFTVHAGTPPAQLVESSPRPPLRVLGAPDTLKGSVAAKGVDVLTPASVVVPTNGFNLATIGASPRAGHSGSNRAFAITPARLCPPVPARKAGFDGVMGLPEASEDTDAVDAEMYVFHTSAADRDPPLPQARDAVPPGDVHQADAVTHAFPRTPAHMRTSSSHGGGRTKLK
ncbi:hypothetical protein IMZ48_11340 [Candidatus Bathyarchaeota archaeon]|nr:hypothetical protein [Candidatus Bathyarchaeota archaeon]